jgi:hypothetical protein
MDADYLRNPPHMKRFCRSLATLFTPAVDPQYVDHLLRCDPGRLECHGSP